MNNMKMNKKDIYYLGRRWKELAHDRKEIRVSACFLVVMVAGGWNWLRIVRRSEYQPAPWL
jgi:hypothetical protein